MKQFFILTATLACLTLASCSKDNDQPEKLPANISKLIDESNCVCLPYVNLYTWNNQQVYVLAFKGPACDWTPGYFNSQGQTIQMAQDYSFTDFLEDSKLVKNVWSCEEEAEK
ncbi:hypothetical protein HB364_14935 [Pseudoflavitalea sp. X16]|uniref:hypothetical protein n=1 Tax=Paraflavitalea devenefica TaxID=2716334 RepID=UPI0014216E92|nr:hypothetical protein [Paraflavitalea devenefica]NII26384.1 hypothetical protein [Paraflavitalea devenefica]